MEQAVAPSPEREPPLQDRQAVAPLVGLYIPVLHNAHVELLSLKLPAGQFATQLAAPGGEIKPVVQAVHTVVPLEPV